VPENRQKTKFSTQKEKLEKVGKIMKITLWSDIPIIEPDVGGYWEIYDDGRKIWHKNEYPQNNSMKIKPPSEYVMPKVDVRDGDYITILNEGEYRNLPQDPSREVLTFKVKLPSGDEKKLSMNPTSQKELIMAWGDDSRNWINKRCLVEIVRQKVFTQMKDVIFLHPEGGTFSIPEEEIPEREPEPPEEG